MYDFNTVLICTSTAGCVVGGILGVLHHQLKPLNLSRPICYVIGSIPCLIGLNVTLWITTRDLLISVAPAWGVWSIAGAYVIGTYIFDEITNRKRIKRVLDEAANHSDPERNRRSSRVD